MFRLGLIGGGRMGANHLRALADSPRVTVGAIVDPSASVRAALSDRGLPLYETVSQLLDAGGIDGVLVAAPSDRHAAIISEVAATGMPILCEKPCGVSTAELQQTALLIEAHDVRLQVAYWRRHVAELQTLRASIQDGQFGDIHFIASYQWDGQPPAARFRVQSGGIFVDMGVHEFDQIRWLTGQEIGAITALASPLLGDAEVTTDVDSAQAIASLSGGANALISLGRYYPVGDMARVDVFGTRDAARIDFFDPTRGDEAQLDALRSQAESFAIYASGGPSTGASIADAAAALEVAERASAQVPALARVREESRS